jgi:hypothetical protein
VKVEILFCRSCGFQARAASLALRIKDVLGIDPVLKTSGPGTFDVLVDGERIASRGEGFLSRLFFGGWPNEGAVVEEIKKRSSVNV